MAQGIVFFLQVVPGKCVVKSQTDKKSGSYSALIIQFIE